MSTINLTLIFLFLTSIQLLHLPTLTVSDDTCPYPCYPPPAGTGTGTGTGTGSTPATPASQSGSYSPPAGNYPSPTGNNFPYNYPPPSFGNNNNNNYGQSPPDPILPYFPYYYRKPPHKTDESPATTAAPISIFLFAIANLFFSFFIY